MQRRRWLLGAALVASVVAAVFVGGEEEATGPAPSRAPRAAAEVSGRAVGAGAMVPREQSVMPSAQGFEREEYADETENLFPARSWRPPPPPPPAAAEVKPPPPSAPPLPFQYLGKLQEGEQTVVFLSQQERTHTVRQGDTLAGVYRVERITPESMVLVYLPLKQAQTLPLGRMN